MNVLLVHAHPEPRSFNGAMRDTALDVLAGRGHDVELSDLYAMDFGAAGGPDDFRALTDPDVFRYQREQLHACEEGTFAPEVRREIEKVREADVLLFQFPLWWFGLPAILKGWFDRVFAMGFAYDRGRLHDTGPLAGRRAMLALTTGSPEPVYSSGGRNGPLDTLLFPIQYGILHFVGLEVLPPFVAYGAVRVGADGRSEYLEAYRRRLERLESTEPLTFDPATCTSRPSAAS